MKPALIVFALSSRNCTPWGQVSRPAQAQAVEAALPEQNKVKSQFAAREHLFFELADGS
jgi:hypothetical protein